MNEYLLCLLFFVIGFIELFMGTLNFKFTQRSKILFSSLTTFFNTVLMIYVICALWENMEKAVLVGFIYAVGCALGDAVALKYDDVIDKKLTKLQKIGKIRRGKFLRGRK